ncbi:mettl21a [Symbiodinium natans]|uniref:Mettl21a protein n=1 Tax=Symbiodinium natans TaxID=878477 RepID=A0A812R1A9_9DINO|nr:mettl21a [Symbiodinium natans]
MQDDASSSSSEVPSKRRRRLPLPACVAELFGNTCQDDDALVLVNPVVVRVVLGPKLRLRVLEASPACQEAVIEQAVKHAEADRPANCTEMPKLDNEHRSLHEPKCKVLAQAIASYVEAVSTGCSLLELGAGCGMVSLTAARLGFDVLATDFRSSPLRLVAASARQQGLSTRVRTSLLDICDFSTPLPPARIIVAADVLYDAQTAEAMARRVAEAHLRGSVVLLADVGRPNRSRFLSQLRQLLPSLASRLPGFDFPVAGLAVQETDGVKVDNRRVPVQLLELPFDGPASKAVRVEVPARGADSQMQICPWFR